MTTNDTNPCGIRGLEFVEWATDDPAAIAALFRDFGCARTGRHRSQAIDLFEQHDIHFLLNSEPTGFAAAFFGLHGPSISALGLRVDDARAAFEEAVRRGGHPFEPVDGTSASYDLPAICGIGGSLVYFVDRWGARGRWYDAEFAAPEEVDDTPSHGFLTIDHLTNNVEKGTLETWADFYKDLFGFTEVRHFDIRGEQTGLYSYALRSPCKTFCIPINEGTEEKSQIEEYLREYKGPGVQHLAFLSDDLLSSLDAMRGSNIDFLDIDDEYYETVFDRVPNVHEDPTRIRAHQVLVDGDDDGYLLQIFTRNIVGPIFIELIQRRNHHSFGEGNFGALFRSIERDQERRGVL